MDLIEIHPSEVATAHPLAATLLLTVAAARGVVTMRIANLAMRARRCAGQSRTMSTREARGIHLWRLRSAEADARGSLVVALAV